MLLIEPSRPASLPTTRSGWMDRHLSRICTLSELTTSQFRSAEDKYHAVGAWLSDVGSPLAPFRPDVYPQGSMSLGTTVQPYGQSEYDLDLVCQLHWCAHEPPLTIYDWVHDRMATHETYKAMLEKLKRCLRLNYAGSFHLDILPACPNENIRQGSIIVPDRKLECWVHSNPRGFAAWFLEKCQMREEISKRAMMDAVAPLPSPVPSEYKFPLQRVVQLMKRHRDIFFHGGRDIARSVILTTLAGRFYTGQQSLSSALEGILDRIHKAFELHPTVPRIENPVHQHENFTDTWDDAKYEKFKAYITNFRTNLKAALYPGEVEIRKGLEATTDPLAKLFGSDRVKDAIQLEAKDINDRRKTGTLGLITGGALSATSQAKSIRVPRNQFYGR